MTGQDIYIHAYRLARAAKLPVSVSHVVADSVQRQLLTRYDLQADLEHCHAWINIPPSVLHVIADEIRRRAACLEQ